jgi:SecD/SecF fusion protein
MDLKAALQPYEHLLPYMVMVVGIAAAALFVVYFAAETDKRKRNAGTVLSILLGLFSFYCVGLGLKKGIDLQGGASFLVKVQAAEGKEINPDSLRSAQEIIENRLNPSGALDVTVTPQGTDKLYVEVPGLSDEEIRKSEGVIERVAKLEFHLLSDKNIAGGGMQPNPPGDPGIEPGFKALPYQDSKKIKDLKTGKEINDPNQPKTTVFVKNKAEMGGKSVKSAFAALAPGALQHHISVTLHDEFGEQMSRITKENLQKPLAIVLDGVVISAPTIQSSFGAQFQITGGFDETEARDLASALENPLENPLLVEQSSTTSASYGEAVINQGLYSALFGLLSTLVFMMIYYRLSGIIAVIGLAMNLLLLLGAMQVFGFTLTMPGIAGIILTLGMAVDANVLIYERMREEFAAGKSFSAAIKASYEKAFSAIFDSNITTLITSVIMMVIATGAIRGFGLSLTIGLLASMFSALLITRVCFLWVEKFGVKKLSFLNLISNRLIDFMGMRKKAFLLSGILILISVSVIAFKGQRVLGYELRGGDSVSLASIPGLTEAQITQSLADFSLEVKGQKFDASSFNVQSVKPVGGNEYFTIRSAPGTADALIAELQKDLAGNDPEKAKQFEGADKQSMGSSVGDKMLKNSMWAIVMGLIGIFIYLTFRFESAFAIGVIIAVMHDVIIAVGACALVGKEVGLILVGAFLTIAGYSVNDTIVIFDRVREELRTRKGDLSEVLNYAISATLSRTIITSGVTALAVIAMLLFGGKSLADFSFAMLIGMISGTYSTIFIAAPVVLWWAEKRKLNLRKQILDADAQRLEALSGIEREAPEKPVKPAKI